MVGGQHVFLIFFVLLCYMVASEATQLVNAATWVEVGRWTGSAFPDQETFSTGEYVCNHTEWRVRWNYVAVGDPFESILTIRQGGNLTVFSKSYFSQNGVKYFHDQEGNFSLSVFCANMNEYAIVIEQDIDSIPEYPLFLLLPLFVMATMLTIAVCKTQKRSARCLFTE